MGRRKGNTMIEFKDSYAGWVQVQIVRSGKGWRFRTASGGSIGTFRAPFATRDQAETAARRYPAIFRFAR